MQEAYQALSHAAAAGSKLDCYQKAKEYSERINVLIKMKNNVSNVFYTVFNVGVLLLKLWKIKKKIVLCFLIFIWIFFFAK